MSVRSFIFYLFSVLTCEITFTNRGKLIQHLRIGKHVQPCPQCGKTFKKVSSLNDSLFALYKTQKIFCYFNRNFYIFLQLPYSKCKTYSMFAMFLFDSGQVRAPKRECRNAVNESAKISYFSNVSN